MAIKWAYGVTTVPQRISSGLLSKTLTSLALAGFDDPRLFVDGNKSLDCRFAEYDCTYRKPRVQAFGNWALAAWELYVREPSAHRYAIFQDDLLTYRNLRQYLERCKYPQSGYLNLFTLPCNEEVEEGVTGKGWYPSDQMGKGALALVFSKDALTTLLSQPRFIQQPTNSRRPDRCIDGTIIEAMANAGYQEYVHNPSLVKHTGLESVIKDGRKWVGNPELETPTFRGEDFDALDLLKE